MVTAKDADKSAKFEARAERILDAAGALVLRYGFDKTTVDDIARETGVSKGAIYLHWPSKDDLFEALIWRETWAYVHDMLNAIEADPEGGTLAHMFKHALEPLTRRPIVRALYNRDLHVLGDFLRRRDPTVFVRRDLLNKEFIRLMQKAGLVRPELNSQHVGYIFSCLTQGILTIDKVIAADQIPAFEPMMETLVDMLTKALVPDSALSTEAQSAAGKRILSGLIDTFKQMTPDANI